jgi:hypothetical protein
LPQGDAQGCFQGVVEDRFARAIGKIGEDDGVLVG